MANTVALITTELEETWPDYGNVLFLGEWCRIYSRRDKWARLSGSVMPYHWDDRQKLKTDYAYLEGLKRQLLVELVPELNKLHGVKFDLKFWRLLVGYWLNIYTSVLFDRWSSINAAVNTSLKLKTIVIKNSMLVLVASDTESFISQASENPYWNHAIFSILIQRKNSVEVNYINSESVTCIPKNSNKGNSWLDALKPWLKRLSRFLSCAKKEDRFLLAGTYMAKADACRLEAKLGQLPNIYLEIPENAEIEYIDEMRQWSLPSLSNEDEFGLIARELIPKLIPKIFVEGFCQLQTDVDNLPWASMPYVIWTSNYHFGNDLFTAWASRKCQNGARLVIGEHGGIGLSAFNSAHNYELSIADLYISTGWTNLQHSNVTPVGNFRKGHSSKLKKYNSSGRALLVCGSMPRYSIHVQSAMLSSQVCQYIGDQFSFFDALPGEIQENVSVRLHPADYRWEQRQQWVDRFPFVFLDDGQSPMVKVISKSRLFIGTYNATSYTESLCLNFPTVIFWNPMRWEVKHEYQFLFERLRDVGIFHETPGSAAQHVTKIWNDIPGWWQSDPVQSARKLFCDTYVVSRPDLIARLKGLLLEEAERSIPRS